MEILHSAVYATQPAPLKKQVETLLREANQYPIEDDILGLIVPDSNLLSGGPIAAQVFKTVVGKQYDTVIMISSSHTGPFRRMNICSLNKYLTPLGQIAINERVCHELCDEDDDIFIDDMGHFHNKGIDVQLPFLQTILHNFDIVPIVMGEESPEFCRELGAAISEIMFDRKVLIVASVDVLAATQPDIDQLQTLFQSNDVKTLIPFLNRGEVSLQGSGPLLVAMMASSLRNGKRFQTIESNLPSEEKPGYFGAYISK